MASAAQWTAAMAAMNRASALSDGVVAYLQSLPSDTTVGEVVAKLTVDTDELETSLRAHVPDVPPTPPA